MYLLYLINKTILIDTEVKIMIVVYVLILTLYLTTDISHKSRKKLRYYT